MIKGAKTMLDIIPALLLVTGTAFFILLIVLNTILYKPLIAFLDNRNSSIGRDLESAGKNTSDVAAYYEEIEAILAKARVEASRIKDEAVSEAKEKALKVIERKKSEIEAQKETFLKQLDSDKVAFKNDILAQAPLFKESLASKLTHI